MPLLANTRIDPDGDNAQEKVVCIIKASSIIAGELCLGSFGPCSPEMAIGYKIWDRWGC